jgi:hypothetical protein
VFEKRQSSEAHDGGQQMGDNLVSDGQASGQLMVGSEGWRRELSNDCARRETGSK